MKKSESKQWIKENIHLFKNLKKGVIYSLCENEKPIDDQKCKKPKYKTVYVRDEENRITERTNKRYSEKGNLYLCKIALCEDCGEPVAASKLRVPKCDDCLHLKRKAKMLARHYGKPSPIKKKKIKEHEPTAKEIAFAITGDYPRVYRDPAEYERYEENYL